MFNSLLKYDPEDEHGTWTHDQLIEMDERFVAAPGGGVQFWE
jgi:hypothetical protein